MLIRLRIISNYLCLHFVFALPLLYIDTFQNNKKLFMYVTSWSCHYQTLIHFRLISNYQHHYPPFNGFFSHIYVVGRMICFFHLGQSSVSIPEAPTSLISVSTVFLELFFARPRRRLPVTSSSRILPGRCSWHLLLTRPNHRILLCLNRTSNVSTSRFSATFSLLRPFS